MKLTLKLTLSFLVVSLIAIGLAAVFIWGRISSEFTRYLENQRQNDFVLAVTAYYTDNQSWQGVDAYLRQQGLLPPVNELSPPPQPFVLIDADRAVIVASEPYQVGERVKRGEIAKGIPISITGQTVGTVISTGQPLVRKPIDQKYVEQINLALWIAGLSGAMIAFVLGFLMARSLTRPVRELTNATRSMSHGELEQQVPVRSADELGELAASFNQMSADLARSNKARRQMTADIAHDLRNPLMVIGGYLEALKDGTLAPTSERYATMETEVQHMQRLVDDLRTLSLADAGELHLHRQPSAPRDLLERVASAYRLQAEQRNINLTIQVEPGLPEISLDTERMEQVLGNLISNALRYTPDDGEIYLSAHQQDGKLLLCIQDNGSGIPPDILPNIFERSYRGDPSRSGSESGLGLAIAKSIVELHGGSIHAESNGIGSKFTIFL